MWFEKTATIEFKEDLPAQRISSVVHIQELLA